jgi:hypothetical protein
MRFPQLSEVRADGGHGTAAADAVWVETINSVPDSVLQAS